MTVDRTEIFDFVEQLRHAVLDAHTAARVTIDQWFVEMRVAADHGDAETVLTLARRVADKVRRSRSE